MYRREVSVCVDGRQRTQQAAGLPAIGCCFLFLSAATRHTDAWQRARVQAGSSTQSSDYRDAGSRTFSYESVPSSSCRSSCHRVPAGRIWGCHWTAIRRCGAPPMWFAACRSPWASCQQNWTWPWLPTVANRATVGSQWVRAGGRKKWADFGPGTLILIKFRRNPEISSTPYFESNFEKSGSMPMRGQRTRTALSARPSLTGRASVHDG